MGTYCFNCRLKRNKPPIQLSGRLLNSDYQRAKHEKHTVVDASVGLQSVFSDTSTASIRADVEEALLRGPMRIEGERTDFFAPSGSGVGVRYEYGMPIEVQDVTVVAKSSASDRLHQFPESSHRLAEFCDDCDKELFS